MIRKVKNVTHMLIAIGSQAIFGFPAKKLHIIGVTGTDGKTTTSSMIYHILKSANRRVSLLSTLGAFMADGKVLETGFHTTTPSAFYLQKYLRHMHITKSDYVVLEVTSHALDQNRIFGIPFEIGVFTNISHEHLDYHETMEKYLLSKVKLLLKSKTCVVNADDAFFYQIKPELRSKKVISFGLVNSSDITGESMGINLERFSDFNKKNALAAIAVANELGIELATIQKALDSFVFPEGRQEVIFDKGFTVIVDFAHTPRAFEEVLSEIKKKTKGRLIHVFGAAGKRDKSKRPLMGKASSLFSDVIVLTAEDPRGESVDEINREISSGFSKKVESHLITDRRDAIAYAVSIAKENDTVFITGKGHEKSMNLGDGENLWSDHVAVEKALQKRFS